MADDGNDTLMEKVITFGTDTLSQKERDFTVAALRAGAQAMESSDVQGYGMAVVDRADATGTVTTREGVEALSLEEFETLVGKLRDLTSALPQDEANALAIAFWHGVQQSRTEDSAEVEGYAWYDVPRSPLESQTFITPTQPTQSTFSGSISAVNSSYNNYS